MTSQRRDNHSTEFGLWLRQQPEIASDLGYLATNIDFQWRCYSKGDKWLLLEEKRRNIQPARWQQKSFKLLHDACLHDAKYHGFHVLIFEATNPDDGKMWLNHIKIERHHLIGFLTFSWPRSWYLDNNYFKRQL